MRVLLIEDDPAMQLALQRSLGRRQMDVHLCGDGALALARWRELMPDVVLLDLTLPQLDGLEVLAAARAAGLRTPVLLLTARGTVGDRVLGLNTGADDYLPKPFDLDELEARVRALRRRQVPAASPAAELVVGTLRADASSGAIHHQGQVMELTPRELSLLRTLMARPGHAVGKERLFDIVFADDPSVQIEAIEVVIYRLRKKLVGTRTRLMTLRGLGYLLREDKDGDHEGSQNREGAAP